MWVVKLYVRTAQKQAAHMTQRKMLESVGCASIVRTAARDMSNTMRYRRGSESLTLNTRCLIACNQR